MQSARICMHASVSRYEFLIKLSILKCFQFKLENVCYMQIINRFILMFFTKDWINISENDIIELMLEITNEELIFLKNF